mmetsp:Transcript_37154/g.54341  ORF Transcript_37154/g.54341 Transcript_37154/m.54341 type:complete len:645 (+) Transcript_37154:162-2096(+)
MPSGNRKQQGTKKKGLVPIIISNSVGDTKKFTRKDLEEACRKLSPAKDSSTAGRRCRAGTKLFVDTSDVDAGTQLRALDTGVKVCARKYNECKAQADRLEEELGRRVDEFSGLEQEAAALHDMIGGNNPEAKKISNISASIEETGTKSEAKLEYRMQLHHMHQRLRKNSVSLDAHMSAMSETIQSASKEKQRCERMLGEVESGLSNAIRELEDTIHEIDVTQTERRRAMITKKIEADNAERLEAWRHERDSSRLDFDQSLGGTYKSEREKRLRTIRESENELNQLNKSMETKLSKFASLEEAFTHNKQATGVNSLAEMVEKFTNHQEHRDRLLVEKKEAEERLGAAKQALEQAHAKFEVVKADGFGDTELSREILNEINEQIAQERTKVKVVKSTNVRLEGVLVGLRQGGMGLYQRLLPFHPTLLEGDAPNLSESATTSAVQAAYDTLEMIKVTEQILGKMLDSVGGVENISGNSKCIVSADSDNATGDENVHIRQTKASIETLENPNLGDNNCRIKAKATSPRSYEEDHDDDSGFYSEALVDDTDVGESAVPSRTFLKTNSEHQASEAKRQAELEEKRQKMREKEMSADEGQNNIATIKKMQAEATTRMAQHILPIGLPKSLSIRDDPMTKAQAFLTEMPNLE